MKRTLLDDLPLFADDAAIGQALIGTRRASEWRALAPLYEARGFPKVDEVMGGRYVPAIRAFFDLQYGLSAIEPKRTGGVERPDLWNVRRGKRPRSG
jgi:hypothetical protein